MANQGNMRKKIKMLENKVLTFHEPDRGAIRWPDGSYDYNNKRFPTAKQFEEEVDRLFKDWPPDPPGMPRVLVISLQRPREKREDKKTICSLGDQNI